MATNPNKRWTQSFGRRRVLAGGVAFGVGAAGLAAVGCGDDDDDDTGTPANPTAAGAGTSAGAAQPKTGGTLRIHMPVDPPNLDFHRQAAHQTYQTAGLSYNQLFTFATGPGQEGYGSKLVGDLAGSWEQPDKTTVKIVLKDGVTWHNVEPTNGRALTAEDVAYSFTRMMDTSQPETAFLSARIANVIESVKAVDAKTVLIKTKMPYGPILPFLADINAYIVPREAVEKWGDLKEHAVGTGPFILRKFERGNAYHFERNPSYFMKGMPYVDKLEYLVVPDPALQISSVRSGQISIAGVSAQQNDDLAKDQLSRASLNGYTGTYVYMNRTTEFLKDFRVRRAISLATDRDAIIKAVPQGKAVKYVALPGVMRRWQLPEAEVTKAYTLNIADAKALLSAAGFGSGLKMTWEVPGQQQPAALASLEILQQQLKVIGIELQVANVEYATWQKHLADYSLTATVSGARPHQDPDLWTYLTYHPQVNTRMPADDPAFIKLLEQQRDFIDETERVEVLRNIQRKELELCFNVYLFDPNPFFVAQRSVADFVPTGVTGQRNLQYVWLNS